MVILANIIALAQRNTVFLHPQRSTHKIISHIYHLDQFHNHTNLINHFSMQPPNVVRLIQRTAYNHAITSITKAQWIEESKSIYRLYWMYKKWSIVKSLPNTLQNFIHHQILFVFKLQCMLLWWSFLYRISNWSNTTWDENWDGGQYAVCMIWDFFKKCNEMANISHLIAMFTSQCPF